MEHTTEELLEKNVDKGIKPKRVILQNTKFGDYQFSECGRCETVVENEDNYCRDCGAKIDWN